MITNVPVNCRLCKSALQKLISLPNIPKQAQYLPSRDELRDDDGVTLTLFYCPVCGVIQHDLAPVEYYKDVIRATGYSAEMKTFRTKQLAELVTKYNLRHKKVLEIGSGNGEYLSLLKDAGMTACGVEHNKTGADNCKKQGLNIINTFLGDDTCRAKLPDGPFDAFFSFNFFEHLPDLPVVLRAINDNLTDEGLGFVEVPNFDRSITNNIITDIVPDHIYYFTAVSLTNLLQMNGFDVLDTQCIWHDNILFCIVKKRKTPNLDGFLQYKNFIYNTVHSLVEKYPKDVIAVWGAGHESLSALAMCDKRDLDHISVIIDSAPFKQNKYAPVTHIPITAPSILNEHTITVVLIIAGAYNDEIARYIHEHHKDIVTVILSPEHDC